MITSFLRCTTLPFVLVSLVSLTACESNFIGGSAPGFGGKPVPDPGGPGGPSTGRETFLMSVGSSLQSCAACHAHAASGAPIFLGDSPGASYVMLGLVDDGGLIAAPQNSLLTHHGTHAGPDVTAEQRQIINDWLEIEMFERNATPQTSQTLEEALTKIGGCMSQSDWTAHGLDALANVDANGAGACSACHSGGTGGVFLSADANETFNQNKQFPFINRWVRGKVDSTLGFQGFTPADVWVKTGSASCDAKAFKCHPPYQLPQALSDGIGNFINVMILRWNNQQCPGP